MDKSACPSGCPFSALLKRRVFWGFALAMGTSFCIFAGGWLFGVLVLGGALLAVWEFAGLVRRGAKPWVHGAFALAYLCLCFSALVFLRFGFDLGAWLTFGLALAIWASDTGAYIAGKSIGGPKMAPRLSPGKTWAGFAGALVSCGVALLLWDAVLPAFFPWRETPVPEMHAPALFLFGLLLGAVGQGGDLLISFYKRRAGVKDTGCLIPGHGGILDRIDSLLLASPVFLGGLLLCL